MKTVCCSWVCFCGNLTSSKFLLSYFAQMADRRWQMGGDGKFNFMNSSKCSSLNFHLNLWRLASFLGSLQAECETLFSLQSQCIHGKIFIKTFHLNELKWHKPWIKYEFWDLTLQILNVCFKDIAKGHPM